VINGATKEIGKAAVVAVTKARGMEVAGAVDTCHIGEDIGKVFFCLWCHYPNQLNSYVVLNLFLDCF